MEHLEINQYLTFNLAGEIFAINVANVREVLELPKITQVPRMPDFLSGVFNLRGNIIPLLDLRLKFGLGVTQQTNEASIIVTEVNNSFEDESESLTIGILSEGEQKVVTLDPSCIKPPPKIGTSIDTSFLIGMGQIEDIFVLLLDIEKLLAEKELILEKKVVQNEKN